jgi:hypothetical protein
MLTEQDHGVGHGSPIGHVGGDDRRRRWQGGGGVFEFRRTAGHQPDAGATVGDGACDRQADPTRSPGHDDGGAGPLHGTTVGSTSGPGVDWGRRQQPTPPATAATNDVTLLHR